MSEAESIPTGDSGRQTGGLGPKLYDILTYRAPLDSAGRYRSERHTTIAKVLNLFVSIADMATLFVFVEHPGRVAPFREGAYRMAEEETREEGQEEGNGKGHPLRKLLALTAVVGGAVAAISWWRRRRPEEEGEVPPEE